MTAWASDTSTLLEPIRSSSAPLTSRYRLRSRHQLARVAKEAKGVLQTNTFATVADRGYFSGEQIVACDEADIKDLNQSIAALSV